MIAPWAKEYIGIPFEPKGRTREGCDCYGLLCLVYREQMGVELPTYTDLYEPDTEGPAVERLMWAGAEAWGSVPEPERESGDAVLLRRMGHATHVGVYVGGGRVLHCDRGVGAAIDLLNSIRWRGKVQGYYRVRKALPAHLEANQVVCAVKMSPFSQGARIVSLPQGPTLAHYVEHANIPEHYQPLVVVLLDGEVVPREMWSSIRPKVGHRVEIICVPQMEVMGWSSTTMRTFWNTISWFGSAGIGTLVGGPEGYLAQLILGIAGTAAINQLIPPATPPKDNPDYTVAGGNNLLRPYDPVPQLFGKMRITPQLAARPYTSVKGDEQYVHMLYLLGKMPISVIREGDSLRIGDEPLGNFGGKSVVKKQIRDTRNPDKKIKLYEGDVRELSIGVKLEDEDYLPDIQWTKRTTEANPDRISIDLLFPRGLYFQNDGDVNDAAVKVQVQYRELPFGKWRRVNPWLAEPHQIVIEGPFRNIILPEFGWFLGGAEDMEGVNDFYLCAQEYCEPPSDGAMFAAGQSAEIQALRESNPALARTASFLFESRAHLEHIVEDALDSLGSGDRSAPQDVLDRIDYRLAGLGDRVDALRDIVPGWANELFLDNIKTRSASIRTEFSGWGACSIQNTTDEAGDAIDLVLRYHETIQALVEVGIEILNVEASVRNITFMVDSIKEHLKTSDWFNRLLPLLWQTFGPVHALTGTGNETEPPTAYRPDHTFVEDNASTFRVSGSWAVESDAAFGGDVRYEVRIRRYPQFHTWLAGFWERFVDWIRFWEDNPDDAEDEASDNISDEVHWETMRTHRVTDAVTDDDVALIALRIRATEALQGTVSGFNVLVEAPVPVYDESVSGADYDEWVLAWTRNPAWSYLRVLYDAMPTATQANFLDKVDLPAFINWADACDDDSLDWTFDAYLTRKTTVFKLLKQIAAAGRAAFTMREGKYSIVQDVEQTVPVQHFTPRNSSGFRATRRLATYPHGLRCRFVNEDADYETDEILVFNDGYSDDPASGETIATVFEDMEFYGITNAQAVHREARYQMAVAQLRPETVELQTDFEHLLCTVGDLVLVTHDAPMWGLGYGRVTAINGTTISLDEPVEMASGDDYSIRFRLNDGSSVLRTVTTNPGAQTQVIIDSTVTGLAVGDLFMFGEQGSETRELLVKEIKPGANLSAKLLLVDHAPAVHDADTEEIPDYEPGITIPPVVTPTLPSTPHIATVIADEGACVRVGGALVSGMRVLLRPPANSGAPARWIEGDYRRWSRNAGGRWTRLAQTPASGGVLSIYPVEEQELYDVRVRYVTEGGLCSAWTTREKIYVVGMSTPPPDVKQLYLDDWRTLRWRYPNPPRDFVGFEIRVGCGDHVYRWNEATPIHEGLVSGTTCPLPDGLSGLATILIKAVDYSGIYSPNAARLIQELREWDAQNVVSETELYDLAFPGTYENMKVANGGELVTTGTPGPMWDDDSAPMWDDDSAPMWGDFYCERGEYKWFIEVDDDEIGTTLTIERTISGAPYRIEYRPCTYTWPTVKSQWLASGTGSMFSASGDPATGEDIDFFPASGEDLFKAQPTEWRNFTGSMDLLESAYEFRLVFREYSLRSHVASLNLVVEAPDIEEIVENVGIGINGTRIPITKTYRAITSVALTLQDAGTRGYERPSQPLLLDKNAANGPLVMLVRSDGQPAMGIVDARVKGY